MKIVSWNIRGVGRKRFVQQVHELVNLYHPNILFFVETKISSDRVKLIIKNLCFPFFFEVPPVRG